MSSHSVRRVVVVALCMLALGGSATVACLGRYAGPALAPRAGAARAETVASRIRGILVWLDTVTTPKGAYFWPEPDNVCGPHSR